MIFKLEIAKIEKIRAEKIEKISYSNKKLIYDKKIDEISKLFS